ncbi:site-specific integrase [Sporosarcina beigongshangi]|uniref:site-specific integrase n=1 Tax=Sporosarcina beigongshangi TaxID=2782538 RepID=UPI00193AD00A|nr:site-specific integrase [Sporosarcina beigongshangi]
MEFVEPIRDRKKIEAMKRQLHKSKRDTLLFILGINTAFRVSDLLSLQYKDLIDDKLKPLDHVTLIETKTGKNNKVALTKGVKKAIVDYVEEAFKGDMNGYVFASRKGDKPIQRQQAWQIIKDAANVVGVKGIGTHSLRKTFGFHQYQAGTDITLLMDMLNHSSPAVTLRYIGITQDQKDRAVLALDL